MLLLQAFQVLLAPGIGPQEERRGLREGPLEMDVADLTAAEAVNLAGRTPGTFDQARIGRKLLDPGEAVDVLDLIEDRGRQDLADAVDAPEKIVAVDIVHLHRPVDISFQILDDQVEVVEELKIRLHTLADRREREVIGDSFPIFLPVQPSPDRREVILAVGVLDVGEQFRPSLDEIAPAAKQVPIRPHLPGIDVSEWKHSAAKQSGDFLGIDFVVLGFPPVDGFHIEGVTQNEGNGLFRAEVGKPVPEEDALDADNNILPIGSDQLQKLLRVGGEILVGQDLPFLVDDADVH